MAAAARIRTLRSRSALKSACACSAGRSQRRRRPRAAERQTLSPHWLVGPPARGAMRPSSGSASIRTPDTVDVVPAAPRVRDRSRRLVVCVLWLWERPEPHRTCVEISRAS
eukprot:2871203-Prymnesium_polylepis.2